MSPTDKTRHDSRQIRQSLSRSRYDSFFGLSAPTPNSVVLLLVDMGGDRLSLIELPESEGRILTVFVGWIDPQLNIFPIDDLQSAQLRK